jgi:hypothetical protein
MRRSGIITFLVGASLTGVSIALPVLEPFFCVGLVAMAFGLWASLAATRFRSMPMSEAKGSVQALFRKVSQDPIFLKIAGLTELERDVFWNELTTAAYRISWFQGGYAGRTNGGQIVLGLSWIHLRRVPAAHELYHLARDVIHRCRNGRTGTLLDAQTGILREELLVWGQTLSYSPIGGALEIVVPLVIMVILPGMAFYALLSSYCWV